MLESKIQKQILDYINGLENGLAWKFVKSNEKGTPDIVACINGKFVAIEVKQPGKVPTAIQYAQLARVEKASGYGIWLDSLSRTKEVLTLFFKENLR